MQVIFESPDPEGSELASIADKETEQANQEAKQQTPWNIEHRLSGRTRQQRVHS